MKDLRRQGPGAPQQTACTLLRQIMSDYGYGNTNMVRYGTVQFGVGEMVVGRLENHIATLGASWTQQG